MGLELVAVILAFFGLICLGKGEVYIATVEGEPVVSYSGGIEGLAPTELTDKSDFARESVTAYSLHLERKHDELLESLFESGSYRKLYSYRHLINGFAIHASPEQADILRRAPGVRYVEKDTKIKKLTTHTPQFLGLTTGVWPTGGGYDKAGEDIVIGFIDSGIYPHHPSFSAYYAETYEPVPHYRGKCEVDLANKISFCNGKIVGAQHFAEAAIAAGAFNPAIDFASPFDGDGHGSHVAATAAGNNGIPVRIHGHEFGRASGMAPRARIAVYKAVYRLFGGFVADVVAAIEQAVEDGVDIINLSVGPNNPPSNTRTTFLSPFDAALLSAVKAGVFVAQAAGNGGPFSKTLVSFSPWITSVAAAVDDRRYKNFLTLGNGKVLPGLGLSAATHSNKTYRLVAAIDALVDSSVAKHSPSDCQRPELLNKQSVKGNIILCGYSFNFISGSASVKKVSATAKNLGAAGFVLVVENTYPGTRFEPVPTGIPGIIITHPLQSKDLLDYYKAKTKRDWNGRATKFLATGSVGDGLLPILYRSSPQVAVFSSRGPGVKDFSFQDADILKPDILAPGHLIWAAWSPNGTDEVNYVGEGFAMISGTSMAAPHISGIAALIKQKHPEWSPAAIKSSMMTTAKTLDLGGGPVLAQQYSQKEITTLAPATPFDYGSGSVNPRAALDPGLVFDAGYKDYIGFLCSMHDVDHQEILNITGSTCDTNMKHPANLNGPSIAVSHLMGTLTIKRTVKNVGNEMETYIIKSRMDPEVALDVSPASMTLLPGVSRDLLVSLSARSITGSYNFGEIVMKGSRGHKVRMPVVAMGYYKKN